MKYMHLHSLILLLVFSILDVSLASEGSACSSGVYRELLFLSNYAPAKSYCSDHYPLPVVTVTATAKKKRCDRRAQTTSATTTISTSKTSPSTATTKNTGDDAIWSSLIKSAQSIIATVCTCIETASTKTVTITSSTTKSSTLKTSTTKFSSSTTKSTSATSKSSSTTSKSSSTTKSSTTTKSSSITTKSSTTTTKSTTTKSSTTTSSKSTTTKSSITTSSGSTTSTGTTTSSRVTPTATRCNPNGVQPTFFLKASASGTLDDGRYAFQSDTGGNDLVTFVPEISDGATAFSFDASCHLIGFGTPGVVEIANIDAGATSGTVYFNTADQIAQQTNPIPVAATCDISNGVLQCVDQTATMLFVCTNQLQLQIGATIPPASSTSGTCVPLTLTPIYQ